MNVGWLGEGLLALYCVMALIQFYYLLVELTGIGFSKDKEKNSVTPAVSVIICAKNEYKNLKSFLPDILNQDYPEFQVIVVNDCSWDESAKYLEEMADAYSNLKIVTLKEQEKYPHGKKLALTLGIKGAAYDCLLLTDADCHPASVNWLKEMASNFVSGKDIVIGYGGYYKIPGVLNKWIRFDTVYNALFYLSSALKNKAYMGVGRNLAYRKELFFQNKGFANHYHIMSGDDDLFINETANDVNTSVELNSDSFTYSVPVKTWNSWLHQKKRHMSTGASYQRSDQIFLGTYFLSLSFFYLLTIILLLLQLSPVVVVLMFIIRLTIQLVVFGKGMQKLKENDLIWLTPFFELLMAFIYPLVAASNLVFKTKTWK